MGLSSAGHDAGRMALTVLALLGSLGCASAAESDPRKVLCYHSLTDNRTIYDYEIADVHDKQTIDWSLYRGSVVLLVVVASF